MARQKGSSDDDPPAAGPGSRKPRPKARAAFDIWLDRGLHSMFDQIANEPVPEELLRLIETDRTKK